MYGYSVAAKRRRKRGSRDILAQQQAAEDMHAVPRERDDPLSTVMWARARRVGTAQDKRLLGPIYGEDAGLAIAAEATSREEADRLWALFKAFDTDDAIYSRRIMDHGRFPGGSKTECVSDRMEARHDETPDLRTEDEKNTDAKKAHDRWDALLAGMAGWQRRDIERAAWQMDELHKPGGATVHGKAFVAALRVLAEIVERS